MAFPGFPGYISLSWIKPGPDINFHAQVSSCSMQMSVRQTIPKPAIKENTMKGIPRVKISPQISIPKELWVFFLTVVIAGCGTSSIYINVKRPAEINLKEYRKIAIGDIVDQYGRKSDHAKDMANEITSVLFTSGQFDILDREHLARTNFDFLYCLLLNTLVICSGRP